MAALFNKWLLIALMPIFCSLNTHLPVQETPFHPFHASVTEINHNASDKTLEISCKLFMDDFEHALTQHFKTKVDLSKPSDRKSTEILVNEYIRKNLVLQVDGKPVVMTGIGYENEGEAVYAYYQVDNIPSFKKIAFVNTLMYELFTDQVGIVHVLQGNNRKSTKLNYPDKEGSISF